MLKVLKGSRYARILGQASMTILANQQGIALQLAKKLQNEQAQQRTFDAFLFFRFPVVFWLVAHAWISEAPQYHGQRCPAQGQGQPKMSAWRDQCFRV